MAEKEEYKPFELYKKMKKRAEVIIDTTEMAHQEAFNKAVDDVLRTDEGMVDYEKLKEA